MALQAMVFVNPTVFFPMVWVAPFLVLDGTVCYLGGRSLTHDLLAGHGKTVLRIAFAGLLCGFLWELWNYGATPKWIYHVPGVGWGRIFEIHACGECLRALQGARSGQAGHDAEGNAQRGKS